MRTKAGVKAVREQIRKYEAVGAPKDSALHIYLKFLADLAAGRLAHAALQGSIPSLEEILEHDAIVAFCHGGGGTMITYVHGATAEEQAARGAILEFLRLRLPGPEEFPVQALEKMALVEGDVIAAVTVSRSTSDRVAIVIFSLPQCDKTTAFAALKGAIAYAD